MLCLLIPNRSADFSIIRFRFGISSTKEIAPAIIVYLGWKEKDREAVRLVRNLALGSLALTLAALVANFLTVAAPFWVGDLFYAMLVIVSAPMVCSQTWILSLVLWAALMWTCILLLGKKK